jgi:hypothetical protein
VDWLPTLLAYTVLIFSYCRQRVLYAGGSLLELLQQRTVKFPTRDCGIAFAQAVVRLVTKSALQ